MISRAIHPKRRGRRLLGGLAVGGVAVATLLVATVAFAVHDLDFQLDGDASASTTTNISGTETVDWDSLFNADGSTKGTLPDGFEHADLTKDFNNTGSTFLTNDTSTYATGSKDTLPISTGWQCNFDNNVNSKIDVMNAYAATYVDPATGDEILYFALERNTNTGDANVGFWFLQDEVGCASLGGAVDFTGEHHDGDILIVSAFTKGGDVSVIDAYRWNGDDTTGFLDPNSVAEGADCRAETQPVGDSICAAANNIENGTNGTITVPWLTANFKDGVGHSLRPGEFFEGAINLTDEGLGGHCFNSFLGVTRSSQELTATLFDYAGGTIGQCTSSTTTQAKDGSGASLTSVDIPATGTLEVKDTATVTVNGVDTFDGSVDFYLCGPGSLDTPIDSCDPADGLLISSEPITASGSVTSDSAFLTSAGSYCWHAVFSGDTEVGVPGSEDDGTNECFVVNPLQPTLDTDATDGPVPFGGTITDKITIEGTADQEGTDGADASGTVNATRGDPAGGTIHVDVYGPDSCDADDIVYSEDIDVSGDDDYFTTAFEPTAPGEYVFVASYTGDSPNTLGVDAIDCADQPSDEKVTVEQIPTTIKTEQSWYPNDTATIAADSGDLEAGGKVLFELFDNADCTGDAVYSEEITLVGGDPSEEVGTTNDGTSLTDYLITTGYDDAADSTVGQHSWLVTYTPDASDTAHTGIQSDCAEFFDITYTNDPGPGTDLP